MYIEVEYRPLLQQNRERAFPGPEQALGDMLGKLEVPFLVEADAVEYGVAELQ